jgi:hypothetical protein
MVWAVLFASLVIAFAANLGRATLNVRAALTDKPDIGIYLLLPDEEITTSELLRESPGERDYLVETKDGPKYVKLKKGDKEWYVAIIEKMRE